jgi:hypothetical protein
MELPLPQMPELELLKKEKLLPPVNWRWVKEGDGYVRHEAWPHTPTDLF